MTEFSSRGAGVGQAVWRWWAVAIVPVMVILPFYIFPVAPGGRLIGLYDGRRLLEIAWAAGLVLALFHHSTRVAAVRSWLSLPRSTRLAVSVFLLGALLSSLLAVAPAYALRGWSLMTLLLVVALPLAVVLAPIRPKVLEWVGFTLLLYGIVVFGDPLTHGFEHPRFQGQVLAVTVPALLFSGRVPLALMTGPALAVGIINGSRGMALTIAILALATPFFWPDRRRRIVSGLAGLAVTGVLVGILLSLGHDEPVQAAVQRGTSGRLPVWADALRTFASAPLLGIGPDMMARAPGLGHGPAHPHNSVLLVAGETGLVGLLSLGFLALQCVTRLPSLDVARRPWALALLGGALHSLLSGTIIMPASQTILVLALALVLPTADEGAGPPSRPRAGWALPMIGAVALAILAATLWLPSAGWTTEPHKLHPRFFVDGLTP